MTYAPSHPSHPGVRPTIARKPNRACASTRQCLAGLLALAATAGAVAQTPGTYRGTTDQGQPVVLQIGTDAAGRPALTFVNVVYQLGCAETGRQIVDGYAVSTNIPLDAQGGFNRKLWFIRAFGQMTAAFDGSRGFSGTTTLDTSRLWPSLPVHAEACQAANVHFTATLDPVPGLQHLPTAGVDHWTRATLDAQGRSLDERVTPGR